MSPDDFESPLAFSEDADTEQAFTADPSLELHMDETPPDAFDFNVDGPVSTPVPGPTGATGAAGAAGPPGNDGVDGTDGLMGPPGPTGLTGAGGATGATGTPGNIGPPGSDGPEGPQGDMGPRGLQGETGAVGAQGNIGPPGSDGPEGEPGPMGLPGSTGPTGASGSTNIGQVIFTHEGEEGPQGYPGPRGDVGPQGPIGPMVSPFYEPYEPPTDIWVPGNPGVRSVPMGGTGRSTHASNGVLYGAGDGALNALAVNATATNKYLQQVSSGAPSWQQVAFADLDAGGAWLTYTPTFTASAGTFTAGTIFASHYKVMGKTMFLAISYFQFNVSATPVSLSATLPAGFTAAVGLGCSFVGVDNGVGAPECTATVAASGTTISFFKTILALYGGAGTWATSVGNTSFFGSITIALL